jgi:hypothetical protein
MPTTCPLGPTICAAMRESVPAPDPIIEDSLAGCERAQTERVRNAGEGFGGGLGYVREELSGIAEVGRPGAAEWGR